jgi:RND family efflux transporter MFP subunit
MQAKKIISIIIIVGIILGVYQVFFRKQKTNFSTAEVSKGNVIQEVSATGTVNQGEEINLNFKNSGRIAKINVKVGDNIKANQILAELDTSLLDIQLKEAEANVEAQEAKLIELKKGTRPEEIEVSQTLLNKAKLDLDNLYNGVPVALNQAYNLADNGIRQKISALLLYRFEATIPYYDLTYKYCNNQAAVDATSQRKISENELSIWRGELQNLNNNPQIIDEAMIKGGEHLIVLRNFLNRLNDTLTTDCKLTFEEVSKITTYKLAVTSALTDLNTAITSIETQKKNIETQKLTVKNYQDELDLQLAGATPEQIAYQEALLKQAKIQVDLIKKQVNDSLLVSPTEGQISKINKREGEVIQPALVDSFISIIPAVPFQIKVDIYEEDVVKLNVGNPVDITLTAFPNEVLKGKVVAIDPSEKIVSDVVYYETTIGFDNVSEKIKTGMTADVTIRTQTKENVLTIPDTAIQTQDSKTFVQVLVGKKAEQRKIQIGLKGSSSLVEVISGLKEGEKVITQ